MPKKRAQTPNETELADEAEHTVEDLRRTIKRGKEILKKTQETSDEVEERLHKADDTLKGPHRKQD